MKELRLEATHTHLYPGHRGTLFGALHSQNATCQINFSDGSMTLGTLEAGEADEAILETDPYTTAAGTKIPAKRWRVEISEEEKGLRHFRVLAKMSNRRRS